jgi:hypothetical protein
MSLRLRGMGVDEELGFELAVGRGIVEGFGRLERWEMGVEGWRHLETGRTSPDLFPRQYENELMWMYDELEVERTIQVK